MSLLRLLTTGKSLIGLQNATSRYRMRARFLLPKFSSSRNPFAASTTASEPTVTEMQMPENPTPAPQARPLSEEEVAAANLKETKRLPVAPPASLAPALQRGFSPVAGRGSIFKWLKNPLAWWNRWRTPAPRLMARPGRAPVQGELSLDKITVMRNDLTDADVEIVPAKTQAEPKPRSLPKTEEEAGLLKR